MGSTKRKQTKEKFVHERIPAPIRPLTPTQGDYLNALRSDTQIVVLGPAGTGKTYLAGTHAADCLRTNRFRKVVITRPNVPGGRSLGAFPGSLEEKMGNWVVPLVSVVSHRMGAGAYECAIRSGAIEVVPFEVMRGRSWDNTLVLLDEAQNTTVEEIKMFLTRIGDNSQVILNGDVKQSDLKTTSGLAKVIHIIKSHGMPIPIIEFTLDDIVRSDVCAMWVRAFDKEGL